ncbi:pyridoxal-phosphate dependent enzyme [Luteibacter aegosomaticola]|uniref:threonine ammonia-lyase n=1 Tax=Luteibacter aegosomaticola TaxID=2911538 RepID=UPI001FFBD24F|nr:pyridoxal-phosphate dependent enzyme [Luteibacter aegosomaticola]UPG89920.1 pyridoxal-phosphate dependent enzyme [Luteibacter aegosomaticola]
MLPSFADVRDAAARIAPHARVTPVMRSELIDARAGATVWFKCENLQRGGAFKFRGATNAVWSLSDEEAANGVVTHSSGNHGNALAMAARTRGIAAHVVVPEGAVQAKVDAIIAAGATVHRCAPTTAAREAKAAEVMAATGANLVHPYADARVMAGQGTLVAELLGQAPGIDTVLFPVGGGGLAAGCSIAAHGINPAIVLLGAEPEGADDAARSLEADARVGPFTPDTICDGLRTLIGEPNFHALRDHQVRVLRVSDSEVVAAMRLMWSELRIVVEPSSATTLAAVLRYPSVFAGRTVGAVITGGNVDLDALPW